MGYFTGNALHSDHQIVFWKLHIWNYSHIYITLYGGNCGHTFLCWKLYWISWVSYPAITDYIFFPCLQTRIEQFAQLLGARISGRFTHDATHLILQPGKLFSYMLSLAKSGVCMYRQLLAVPGHQQSWNWHKGFLVVHIEGFQLPAPSKCRKIVSMG